MKYKRQTSSVNFHVQLKTNIKYLLKFYIKNFLLNTWCWCFIIIFPNSKIKRVTTWFSVCQLPSRWTSFIGYYLQLVMICYGHDKKPNLSWVASILLNRGSGSRFNLWYKIFNISNHSIRRNISWGKNVLKV